MKTILSLVTIAILTYLLTGFGGGPGFSGTDTVTPGFPDIVEYSGLSLGWAFALSLAAVSTVRLTLLR